MVFVSPTHDERANEIMMCKMLLANVFRSCYSSAPVERWGRNKKSSSKVITPKKANLAGKDSVEKKEGVDGNKKVLHNLISLLLTNKTLCSKQAGRLDGRYQSIIKRKKKTRSLTINSQ